MIGRFKKQVIFLGLLLAIFSVCGKVVNASLLYTDGQNNSYRTSDSLTSWVGQASSTSNGEVYNIDSPIGSTRYIYIPKLATTTCNQLSMEIMDYAGRHTYANTATGQQVGNMCEFTFNIVTGQAGTAYTISYVHFIASATTTLSSGYNWSSLYFDSKFGGDKEHFVPNIAIYDSATSTNIFSTSTATSTATSTLDFSTSTTHIILLEPANGTHFATTSAGYANNISFDFEYNIAEKDLSTFAWDLFQGFSVQVILRNISQNSLLPTGFGGDYIDLVNENVTEAGIYEYATTTITLPEGCYRVEAKLSQLYGNVWKVPQGELDYRTTSFTVGNCGVIGQMSQNIFGIVNGYYSSTTATTTDSIINSCSNFNIPNCVAFLFTVDGNYLNQSIRFAKEDILNRVPFGYVTRLVNIFNNPASTTLPSFTATIQIGKGDDEHPATTSISINPEDMFAGGASLVDSITDPIHGKSVRDVFYDWVSLIIYVSAFLTIVVDIYKMRQYNNYK